MKKLGTLLLATIPVGLACFSVFVVISIIMWIWNITAYDIAARIAATLFVMLMLLVLFSIDDLVDRVDRQNKNKKWWDLRND